MTEPARRVTVSAAGRVPAAAARAVDAGIAHFNASRFAEAAGCFADAAGRAPKAASPLFFRALALRACGDARPALRDLERVVRLLPEAADALSLKAELEEELGRDARAWDSLRRCLRLEPRSAPLRARAARLLSGLGQTAAARRQLEAAAALAAGRPASLGALPEARAPRRPRLGAAQKRRLRRDGFVVLRGAVPPALVDAAVRLIDERHARRPVFKARSGKDPTYWAANLAEPELLALLYGSPLWGLAQSLLGTGRVFPVTEGQAALQQPHGGRAARPLNPHVDGLVEADPARRAGPIDRFTLLAGVLLSDLPRPFSGNFTALPGSHRALAAHIARHGTDGLRAGLSGVPLPAPAQITGRKGDAVLVHYLVAHDREQNRTTHTRYAAYFRLKSRAPEKPLHELWADWPGIR